MKISYKPSSHTVEAISTLIMPACKPRTISDWATAVVTALGDIIKNATTLIPYWCTSAGTTTGATAPVATDGDDTTDAAVTWRVLHNVRNNFVIRNLGSVNVSLGFGNAAVDGKGIVLKAGDAFNAMMDSNDCPQGDIYAIAASGTASVAIQEF